MARLRRKWVIGVVGAALMIPPAFLAFTHIRNWPVETRGCPWFFEIAPAAGVISPGDYVELERTGCFGPCPVYTVRLYANGRVDWRGEKFVAVVGDQSAKINAFDAEALIRSLRDRGFWSLCGSYIQEITDSDAQITTVRIGSREKRVLNYVSSAPKWLADMDTQIDLLANTHRWRHVDSSVEKLEPLKVLQDIFYPKGGRDDLAGVKRLLAAGADPNARDSSGWTALLYALPFAHVAVAEALLDAGADARIRSSAGQTPIMAVTVAIDRDEKIALLLAAGDDINAQDRDGETALMIASRSSQPIQGIEALLKFGARTDLRDARGHTARDHVLDAQRNKGNALSGVSGDEALRLLRAAP